MHVPHDQHAAPILGGYFAPGAGPYYRLAVPLRTVGGAVAPMLDARVSQVSAAETVVLYRPGAVPGRGTAPVTALVRRLQAEGRRVLIDLDDDLDTVAAHQRGPGLHESLEGTRAALRAADGAVCTNATLAARLRRYARDVRVLPNYVVPADWPAPAPAADGPATLVIAGSRSHGADWRIVAPAVARLKARHGVRLRVCGYCPDYLRPLADDVRPWGRLEEYPAMLAGGQIGLCPLPRTAFNRCKSPIKAYEYALAGLAVVASETQYGPVLRGAGLGAYVAGDRDAAWERAIEALIVSPATRREAAASLRAFVLSTCDAALHAATIRAAYAA